MNTRDVLDNKTCAPTENLLVQESINGNFTNSSMTRIKIKYGNKSLEKDKEENEEINDHFQQTITFDQPIDCIPSVTINSIDSSPNLNQLTSFPPINSGLVVDPDQILNSDNTADEHCNNSGLTSDPDNLFNYQQDDNNLTINSGLISDQDKIKENDDSKEILQQTEYGRSPPDDALMNEPSELSDSEVPADNINEIKLNDDAKLNDDKDNSGFESYNNNSSDFDDFNLNQNQTLNEPFNLCNKLNGHHEIESEKNVNTHCASKKYDYLTMINQEVCGLVNSITEENYRSSEDEVIDDINSESSTVDNLESTFKKPIILEENDAQCIFGWTLLSPGLMEIKINPDSDDSNDVIRIRRTASLQCRIESGDINKLNALRDNNEKTENTNDFGEMEYVDFLEYLSQVTNQSTNEIQENDEQINLVLQTDDGNKEKSDHFNSKMKIMQNIQQMLSSHPHNNSSLENSSQLTSEKKGECGVDVIEGPQEMSFPTEEDNVMSVKFLMPSDSAELQPKTREDGEAASMSKSPDLIELEEANQNLAKEKSLISIRHQQSLEQQHELVEHSRNEKNGKKRKNALYRWLKSKRDIPSTIGNPSNTPNEVKKKKSWFRFWF